MHACKDENALEVFTDAVLREVPLAQLSSYLNHLGKGGPVAIGDACGNGCGSGCGNSCARAIDPLGYTELSLSQLNTIVSNRVGLQKELAKQIHTFTQKLG